MEIKKGSVTFDYSDIHFVNKFGIMQSANMVLDYKSVSNLPFVYDAYQLAHLLRVNSSVLFYLFRNCQDKYKTVIIKKKNGNNRILNVPSEALKNCQKSILIKILRKIPVSKYAKAYVKKANQYDNALPHIGKKYLLKLDICDFFGSIDFIKVYSSAFNTEYFPKQIGYMLTTLCCKDDVLPQGAPTSPTLSNIVMKNFDNNIGKWCKKNGIAYTRYCDDMTFSSDKPLYSVYRKATAMLNEMGFEINESKTHFITNANRQSVTGLTVNEKVSVSSAYKRKLRQDVYYALKFGFSDSIIRSGNDRFITDSGTDALRYYNHLFGQLRYVLQIEPENKWCYNALINLRTAYLRREID